LPPAYRSAVIRVGCAEVFCARPNQNLRQITLSPASL